MPDKRYELDAGGNNTILMSSNVGSGSGKGDYRLLVPDSIFQNVPGFPYCTYGQAAGCATYLVLWTIWGVTDESSTAPDNGGFEEWGVAEYDGSKAGVKYNDLNGNGVRNAGEPGLENWKIFVDLNDNGVADIGEPFDLTDSTGAYLIQPIPPGTWKVREDLAERADARHVDLQAARTQLLLPTHMGRPRRLHGQRLRQLPEGAFVDGDDVVADGWQRGAGHVRV